MYEAREQEDILAELQEASKTPASKIEGTFENDVLASSSIEFAKTEVELEELCKISFAETSYGDYPQECCSGDWRIADQRHGRSDCATRLIILDRYRHDIFNIN